MPTALPADVATLDPPAAHAGRAEEMIAREERWLGLRKPIVCIPAVGNTIVVCAPREPPPYTGPAFAPDAPLPDRVGEKMHAKIGALEVGSIDRGDGTRVLGARIRF